MKWLHISDLHYNPKGDGRLTHQLRDKLIRYLEDEKITADHLFLTGDYRHARFQADGDQNTIESAVKFIMSIAAVAKVPRENIHVIPGNHDLTRTSDTNRVIQTISDYDADNGKIGPDNLEFLLDRFAFFKSILQSLENQGVPHIWNESLQPIHAYRCCGDFNLVYLNTCLTCNSDQDRGELVIGNFDLYNALGEIEKNNPGNPIIVLAHHGMDNFKPDEKMAVEQIFKDYPVKLYLCGDAHNLWQRQNNNVFELTMGCLVQGKNIRTVFSIGELRGEDYSIEAHEWDTTTASWGEYSHFNKQFKKWDIHPSAPMQSALLNPGARLSAENKEHAGSIPNTYGKIRHILLWTSNGHKPEDIFNQLFCDVFHSLGFNISHYRPEESSDIIFQHCTEKQVALVRYSAQNSPIGKDILNVFEKDLEVEQTLYNQEGYNILGYFVSRSGFTSAAIEQNAKYVKCGNPTRSTLLGPEQIVQELIQGNVLCSLETAVNAVKRKDTAPFLCANIDLLACEYGWLWILYYTQNPGGPATHFALVHPDGKQLLNSIANSLLNSANQENYPFTGLTYIDNDNKSNITTEEQAAQNAYFEYLQNELGEIQFEGMPTDQEAGAVKVNLENIFVPLEFQYEEKIANSLDEFSLTEQRTCIDGVLNRTSRAAILAKPGGGKSTLMRRIALAYAYPVRRKKVDDGLPDKNWFPIYIRCRDLGDDVNRSILEIMEKIVFRAEIAQYKEAFCSLIENTLQDGRLLLLIDGLDEISQEKSRICFVNQMRTFVATYPTIHLLITSRETGFRAVAGTLASYCEHYTIAGLNDKQIRQLSLKWHQALLGESSQAEEESNRVCNIILNDTRIISLAENPLLLTTLLFVKRWVGYLPTKKCHLYEEMIKLLLVTWNAAGHDKLDMDETEPQLAFVAYSMTVHGLQKITRDSLTQYVISARKAMPELLSYTELSPTRFIDQVEERSSLLIQMGLDENEAGVLVPSYEFSHLSFQEYLTAKAIAKSWLPETDNPELLQIVKAHIEEDHWQEVIPLAAVLSGRFAKPMIEYLIVENESIKPIRFSNVDKGIADTKSQKTLTPIHLANCIASEVPMSQELLDKALMLIVKNSYIIKNMIRRINRQIDSKANLDIFTTILKSKYGNNYQKIVKRGLFENFEADHAYEFADCWIKIYCTENECALEQNTVLSLLKSGERQDRATAALLMMQIVFDVCKEKHKSKLEVHEIFPAMLQFLQSDDPLLIFSSVWCFAWAGYEEADIIPHEMVSDIFNRLIDLWLNPQDNQPMLQRTISWCIYNICIPEINIPATETFKNAIDLYFNKPQNDFDRCAAIHLAVLSNCWTNEQTKSMLNQTKYPCRMPSTLSQFLQARGFRAGTKKESGKKRNIPKKKNVE